MFNNTKLWLTNLFKN